MADAEFTPSSFGGGWIISHNAATTEWLENFWETPAPLEAFGFLWGCIVEPQDVRELVENMQADGLLVELR